MNGIFPEAASTDSQLISYGRLAKSGMVSLFDF
jgi:hypothetical protein